MYLQSQVVAIVSHAKYSKIINDFAELLNNVLFYCAYMHQYNRMSTNSDV